MTPKFLLQTLFIMAFISCAEQQSDTTNILPNDSEILYTMPEESEPHESYLATMAAPISIRHNL